MEVFRNKKAAGVEASTDLEVSTPDIKVLFQEHTWEGIRRGLVWKPKKLRAQWMHAEYSGDRKDLPQRASLI